MGFVTRWPVGRRHSVVAGDLESDGLVRDATVAEWIEEACVEYLGLCTALQRWLDGHGLALVQDLARPPFRAALITPASVRVTARATEVRQSSFTIAVRVRAAPEATIDTLCIVRVKDALTGDARELPVEVRDELIAIEQSARYTN